LDGADISPFIVPHVKGKVDSKNILQLKSALSSLQSKASNAGKKRQLNETTDSGSKKRLKTQAINQADSNSNYLNKETVAQSSNEQLLVLDTLFGEPSLNLDFGFAFERVPENTGGEFNDFLESLQKEFPPDLTI